MLASPRGVSKERIGHYYAKDTIILMKNRSLKY